MDAEFDDFDDLLRHLKQYEKQVFDDAVYVLSLIMRAKDSLDKGQNQACSTILNFLIDTIHTKDEQKAAIEINNQRGEA